MFCTNCGSQVREGMKFCQNCGTAVPQTVGSATPEGNNPSALQGQQAIQQVDVQNEAEEQGSTFAQGVMSTIRQVVEPQAKDITVRCPQCGSTNVQVQLVERGQQTTKKGVGLGGHVNNMARGMTAVATLGMSNLVWKKSKGTVKTKTVNSTMGICQSCGYAWDIRKGNFGIAPGSILR